MRVASNTDREDANQSLREEECGRQECMLTLPDELILPSQAEARIVGCARISAMSRSKAGKTDAPRTDAS